MASLEQIRDGIKATLEAAIPFLQVYDTVPDAANILPACIVIPTAADFNVAFQRGTDRWDFDLYILASYAEASLGQDALDNLISGAGPNSIRAAIFATKSLGLSSTDANISGMGNYGTTFDVAGIDHVGATLQLVVHTSGTA